MMLEIDCLPSTVVALPVWSRPPALGGREAPHEKAIREQDVVSSPKIEFSCWRRRRVATVRLVVNDIVCRQTCGRAGAVVGRELECEMEEDHS